MKKFWTKLVAIALGAVMALGVGFAISSNSSKAIPVHAASPATLTFTAHCGGSGTDSDGNIWTVTSDAAESTYDSTKGIHYGTGSKAVSYLNLTTSGITGTVTQIVINASGASGTSAKLDVSVGGSAFDSQKSLTSSAASYTLTGSASGTVLIEITQTSATKALYCKSISVTYEAGACTHNWVAGTVHAATCTEAGYTEYECSLCHNTKNDDEVAALGHNYVNYICTRCGAEEPHIIHAGTEQDPYTTADAKIVMDNTGSGVVYQTEVYVSMVPTASSFNSSYNQYTCTDSNIEISSASLGFTPKGIYTETDALVGKTVVAKGYIELYNGVYKMGYLPASVSPTGSKYNPSVVSITPDEGSGEQSEGAYILTPVSGSNNSYAGNCDIAIDGITWNLTGNSQMQPWRIGGKSLEAADKELYSKTAISEEVSKIEVIHGTASGIIVNSWTVIVASDAEFENIISTLTPTFTASDTTIINRPSGVSWKNAYYKFIYNVTVTGTSNKFIEFTRATFYFEQESAGVAAWCASFLSTVKCDVTGQKAPDKTAWDTMKTSYTVLDDADKLTLKTLSNEATVRYDYIIAKYGTTNYENFIGRTITPLGNSRMVLSNIIGNDTVIPVIILVSVLALTSIGAYVFIRKRKEN